MDGDAVEAVGTFGTAALAARAVEPHAGEHDEAGHGACLNCGCTLEGPYCHCCGQAAHVHRSLMAFGHDLAHSVLHFEGKIFRTLPLLFFRPGQLTRRYIHGERAKFVSPMALFLFAVFCMFLVFSFVGNPFSVGGTEQIRSGVEQARANLRAEAEGLAGQRRQVDQAIARARAEGRPTTALELSRRALDARIADTRRNDAIVSMGTGVDRQKLKQAELDEFSFDTGDSKLDAKLAHLRDNPELAIYKLQSSAYKFSWMLIPISVPFIWLLFFWKRGLTVYDHAVFATYSISFVSLLVILLSLLRPIGFGPGLALTALTIIPPIHIFAQLRGAYRLGWFGALWRAAFLATFATFTSLLLFVMLIGAGLLG